MTLCQLVKAIDDFNGKFGIGGIVLMAACAWNLRKWLVIATIFLFWQKLGLFFVRKKGIILRTNKSTCTL
jgi:uncharacterized membrane protein (Fun14 family)